ncbi:MAG TPA: YchJ family metal-binding protein [Burkholderiaceae bacterium]|nr:YchJ family metal-binding protein [Burkholderiaceae bacterium]
MTTSHRPAVESAPCPCRAPALAPRYADCCGRYHDGRTPPPDAEALMRSRYSAYVLSLPDYLLATWHPGTRPATLEPDPVGLKWLGLEVRRHATVDAAHASVEFVARSKLAGRAHRLHEVSRFVREDDGRWYYVDGEIR